MYHVLTVILMSTFFAAPLRGGAPPAGGPTARPYRRILELEQSRTLGHGELAKYLAATDEQLATRAAFAIGRTRLPGGAELLAPHVTDPRVPVRAMSIYGLGLIGTGTQAAAIANAVLHDPSGAVRIAALDALGRYHTAHAMHAEDASAAKAIVQVLESDSDPVVRSRAAITLAYFANDHAVSTLAEQRLEKTFERETDPTVRVHIMWSIFWAYSKHVAKTFVARALHDTNELVRVEAVRAYARWHDKETLATIETFLHDPSWHVQEQAMQALRHLKGEAVIDHFTEIPPYIHLPKIGVDPYASIAPLARPHAAKKPGKPHLDDALFEPKILPHDANDMIGPAPGPHPHIRIVTTKGNIYLTLYPEWAPMTVANFIDTANAGYYDNNHWFRVVPNFVAQTGDPSRDGDIDPGYTIGAEESPLEQRPFVISMGMHYNGSTPIRDSAATQYYLTLSPQYHLNHDFTVFGAVTSGAEVLAHVIESDKVLRVERLPDVTLP